MTYYIMNHHHVMVSPILTEKYIHKQITNLTFISSVIICTEIIINKKTKQNWNLIK